MSRDLDPDQELRVAAAQYGSLTGDSDHNVEASVAWIEAAVASGCRVVVLPELSACGYALASRAEAIELAQPAVGGAATGVWDRLAREHEIYVCGGFAESDGDLVFNSAGLYGPDGLIGVYRKTFLWDRERPIFDEGGHLCAHDLDGTCVGMMICYDAWQPELPRLLKLMGANIILSPTCWTPDAPAVGTNLPHAVHLALVNAHVNRCVIVSADQCGSDRDREYLGMSCITGPEGFLAGPAGNAEGLVVATVRPSDIARTHRWTELSDVFGDRRPDMLDVSYWAVPVSVGLPSEQP